MWNRNNLKSCIMMALLVLFMIPGIKIMGQPKPNTSHLTSAIPLAQEVISGKFSNGLTYYIRVNHKPERRAELRLVINAGSILEEDNQQGLAHFCEHMAFNGTQHFKKQELVNYLESIGMRFGPDLNAYTGFDETVYMLQIPTDTVKIMEQAFQILEDWAFEVSYEADEIDKERGVVIEEWRLGRGASMRMMAKQLPILLKNSQYAQRLPIGKKEILESFKHQSLKDFYRNWYRPDLMAIIAVGDFDPQVIKGLIDQYFSTIPAATKPKPRKEFPVPDIKPTLYAIATDKEAVNSTVAIYNRMNPRPTLTHQDYRNYLISRLYDTMLNSRLMELTQQSEPPYIMGRAGKSNLVRTKDCYAMMAMVKDDGIAKGLETLYQESRRLSQYGFTSGELDRQKTQLLRGFEKACNEKDKTESKGYADELVIYYLEHEPVPGIAYEYEMAKNFVPGILVEEVNQLSKVYNQPENKVIMISTPEKPELKAPTEAELAAVIQHTDTLRLDPYEDKTSGQTLLTTMPQPGKIVHDSTIDSLGIHIWKLSNGIRLILKPTDYKNDEIIMGAFSPGGHSLVDDPQFIPAATAAMIVNESGLEEFNKIQLDKLLTGKLVRVNAWISELQEGLSGNSTPQDLETMFQLTYLYFTQPRLDSIAFLSFQSRMKAYLQNRNSSPEENFRDTVDVTLAQNHLRSRPWNAEVLDKMNLLQSSSIYEDRFSDAGDFTFILVGNLDLNVLRKLAETYLASLPTQGRQETWKNREINPPAGIIEKSLKKGIEPKSMIQIVYTGTHHWSQADNYQLGSLVQVMQIKLRESIREEKSGTYGVQVRQTISQYPDQEYSISISFGCNPDRVSELTQTIFGIIDSTRQYPIKPEYIEKVKEMQKRERETNLKENRFWLSILQSYYWNNMDPLVILHYNQLVDKLDPAMIQQGAQKYFNPKQYVRVVLYPETASE